MIEALIPTLVGVVVDLFTSDPKVVETAQTIVKENATLVTMATVSIPGLFLEFVLRKIKTTQRVSIFLAMGKIFAVAEEICRIGKEAMSYVEKKTDLVVKQRTKDADS